MKSLSEVISTCWDLRTGLGYVSRKEEDAAVILCKADALKIWEDCEAITSGQSLQVAWTRRSSALDTVVESSMVPKPPKPEVGKEWFRVFSIRVIVIDC